MPMHFEPAPEASAPGNAYISRGPGYAALVTAKGTRLRLGYRNPDAIGLLKTGLGASDGDHQSLVKTAELQFQLLYSNRDAALTAFEPLAGYSNYFVGNDQDQWRRNISHYGRIKAHGVYRGIDLVYYGNGKRLEYDFIVSPGVDPSVIAFRYEGIDSQHVDEHGDLVLKVAGATVVQRKPIAYQKNKGQRELIESKYIVMRDKSIHLEIASYDRQKILVIDPVLSYSTYLGGSGADDAYGVAVGDDGSIYVTGATQSTNFDTVNPIEGDSDNADVFIAKLSPNGSSLVYSTYLGGNGFDSGNGIAVDSAGNAYIVGTTQSTDFNSVGPIQGCSGDDAFVAKLNPTGTTLVYATCIGGSQSDGGNRIVVDNAGSAYICGSTQSADFPLGPVNTN